MILVCELGRVATKFESIYYDQRRAQGKAKQDPTCQSLQKDYPGKYGPPQRKKELQLLTVKRATKRCRLQILLGEHIWRKLSWEQSKKKKKKEVSPVKVHRWVNPFSCWVVSKSSKMTTQKNSTITGSWNSQVIQANLDKINQEHLVTSNVKTVRQVGQQGKNKWKQKAEKIR